MHGTRSTVSLPGRIQNYLLENNSTTMATSEPSTEDLIRMASARLGLEQNEIPEEPDQQQVLLTNLLKSLKDLSNKLDE